MAGPPAHFGLNFTPTIHNDISASTDPARTDLSQPSKVVLITGAGRGIGRSIAIQYAASQVATIYLCARTTSQIDEVEATITKQYPSVKVRKIPLDISNEEQVTAAARTVEDEEGHLDILVNNAGVCEPWVPITDSDVTTWWNTWELHIRGTYLMIKAFLPLLKKAKSKADIINMTSIGALIILPGASAYQTSKFAMCRLTEFVHVEYGDVVNCFAVHPGGVVTEMSKDNEQIRKNLTDTPDLCGGFAVWLTKGQRSWLSGRYLSATWDVDELEGMRSEIVDDDKLKMRMVV